MKSYIPPPQVEVFYDMTNICGVYIILIPDNTTKPSTQDGS